MNTITQGFIKKKTTEKNPAALQKEVMKYKDNKIVLNNAGATTHRHCYYNIPLPKCNPKSKITSGTLVQQLLHQTDPSLTIFPKAKRPGINLTALLMLPS